MTKCIMCLIIGKFSNLRLGVYTQYAHENSNQSLYLHFSIICFIKSYTACDKGKTSGVNPASGTANTRPLKV